MTQYNLICEEPFMIGLLGLVSFLSFSIGSLCFTNIIDTQGRKNAIIISSLITPIGIVCMLCLAKDIYAIYGIIFIMGLTYNPRSSTAYIYGTEFLESAQKMNFGTLNFVFTGLF